jgi:hypothetical protein
MLDTFFFLSKEPLHGFLLPVKRNSWLSYSYEGTLLIKDAIESIGVSHMEIAVILINKSIVDFRHLLQNGNTVLYILSMQKSSFKQS